MTVADAWARAYARQAGADLRAWELYGFHPEALAAECHRLQFLQMACEKLCKAHLIRLGVPHEDLQGSHGYTAKHLPSILKRHLLRSGQEVRRFRGVLDLTHHLAREIELLSPAVRRGGVRPDNCEYPWASNGDVISPLDWSFTPARLVATPGGPTFLKLLAASLARLLEDLET
jgi:hypothetical protein